MKKESRYYLANHTTYVVRGNPNQRCFYSLSDYDFYLEQLQKNLRLFNVKLHAYVLTRKQIQLLMTPYTNSGIPLLFKKLEHEYQQRMISRCNTTRAIWTDTSQASIVQPETFLLICSQTIEFLPMALRLCNTPGEHPWSSFKHNALGKEDSRVTEHGCYLKLGKDKSRRSQRYHQIFDKHLGRHSSQCTSQRRDSRHQFIRTSLKQNRPLGNRLFVKLVQQRLAANNRHPFLRRVFVPALKNQPEPER